MNQKEYLLCFGGTELIQELVLIVTALVDIGVVCHTIPDAVSTTSIVQVVGGIDG